MRRLFVELLVSLSLAMASVDAATTVRRPIPIVFYLDSAPPRLRQRPLRRMYTRVWD